MNSKQIIAYCAIGSAPVFLFAIYLIFVISSTSNWKAQLGTFGDSFGALNTLFTGLTFAGLFITILQQRDAIAIQHKELADSRVQFERTATAQETAARLNAYSELLREYESQINKLREAVSDFQARNQEKVRAGNLYGYADSVLKQFPPAERLKEVEARRLQIVQALESFLQAGKTA